MRKWIAVGVSLSALWVFLNGTEPVKIVPAGITGVLIGFTIAYSLRKMYPGNLNLRHWLSVTPEILIYLWIFTKELLVANLDVAKKVLFPGNEIDPDVLEIELRVENSAAVSILANSISLTPGTLTMEYKEGKNSFYVHSITGDQEREEIINTVREWEDLLLKIFTIDGNYTQGNER
jgi:multicomponent Na+:H+ antiporter subunit E